MNFREERDADPHALVFVYGTLKRGFGLHLCLSERGAEFLGEAETEPGYTLVSLGFCPGMIRKEGTPGVRGEVYRVSRSLLWSLDSLEAAYDRKEVRLRSGPVSVAEAYVWPGATWDLNEVGPEWTHENDTIYR